MNDDIYDPIGAIFYRFAHKLENSSTYGLTRDIADNKYKTKGRPMKKPYDLIFDTICRRAQYEKDIMELGNKNNHYNDWNKFLQRYIMCEKYLDKGER